MKTFSVTLFFSIASMAIKSKHILSLKYNKIGCVYIVYWVCVVDLRLLTKIANYRYYLTNIIYVTILYLIKTVFAIITYMFVIWFHV
jgi:hypothetical protein